MRKQLLFIFTLLLSATGLAQISAGQTSDFQSGTQGWKHQISNPFEPIQVTTGGPAGAGDAFLRTTNSDAPSGSGSKHAVINTEAEWLGNYTTAGIVAFTFDVQNPGTETLHLRMAFNGPGFPDWAASTTAMVIAPGTTWTTVTMPVSAADLTVSGGGNTVENILASVTQIRIVSNDGTTAQPIHKGQGGVVMQSDYDNITATDVLSVNSVEAQNTFEISPNPATSKLNVRLGSAFDNAQVTIYDVLGKRVYSRNLSAMTSSIDVSKWNTGVYLVRISADNQTLTKRFVKQ